MSIWLFACHSHPPPEIPESTESPDHRIILKLTDRTLLALSRYRYEDLVELLPPTQRAVSGADIAALLLGPDFADVILEYWDLHRVEVIFDAESLQATAEATIRYRRGPNRLPVTAQTALQFHRKDKTEPWYLHLRPTD